MVHTWDVTVQGMYRTGDVTVQGTVHYGRCASRDVAVQGMRWCRGRYGTGDGTYRGCDGTGDGTGDSTGIGSAMEVPCYWEALAEAICMTSAAQESETASAMLLLYPSEVTVVCCPADL